jgi:hypothetical protein
MRRSCTLRRESQYRDRNEVITSNKTAEGREGRALLGRHTARNPVYLVLDKEIHHGHKRAKEGAGQVFAILNGLRIRWTKGNTT